MHQKSLDNKIGVSFIVPEFHITVGKRTSNNISVYTREMLAILFAMQWVEEIRPLRVIICSDSSSSLISLQIKHSDSRPDILIEIQQTLYRIQMMDITVIFLRVPAHMGVKGNEMADKAAKEATTRKDIDVSVKISKMEIKSIIKQEMKERWQKQWEEERNRRWFYMIQRRVGKMRWAGKNIGEETIISGLRFGHTGLNNTLF
jgi:ribonuclease HI